MGNENALATIRKFTRRVQGINLIKGMRAIRYHSRLRSKAVVKKSALKLLKRRADFKQLLKEGKVVEKVRRPQYQQRETNTQTPGTPSTTGASGTPTQSRPVETPAAI